METATIQAPLETTAVPQPPSPALPRTIQETGLAVDQIEQLLVKTLFTGEATGHVVADRMRLSTEAARETLIARGAKLGKLMSGSGLTRCEGKDPDGNPFSISNRPGGPR